MGSTIASSGSVHLGNQNLRLRDWTWFAGAATTVSGCLWVPVDDVDLTNDACLENVGYKEAEEFAVLRARGAVTCYQCQGHQPQNQELLLRPRLQNCGLSRTDTEKQALQLFTVDS